MDAAPQAGQLSFVCQMPPSVSCVDGPTGASLSCVQIAILISRTVEFRMLLPRLRVIRPL